LWVLQALSLTAVLFVATIAAVLLVGWGLTKVVDVGSQIATGQ